MLKLKTEIATQKGKSLDDLINQKIEQIEGRINFNGLGKKRTVFLDRYLAITNDRNDRTRRKRRFFVGLELIAKVRKKDLTDQKRDQMGISNEFKGITSKGIVVTIHIREQKEGKDKKLFLISTF